jgi:desulfoferrodoxin (superoxide reductase-like protein)
VAWTTPPTPERIEHPTAVPVRVSVEHPMERDHHIRSLEIVVPTDPVAHKGAYRFTPGSGRASVAFPILHQRPASSPRRLSRSRASESGSSVR